VRRDRSALLLAGLLAVAGAVHLVRPQVFDDIVPDSLPGPSRAWNYGAGVAELTCAAAIANPSTRRLGGGMAAVLLVAVFPGNLKMAWDWRDRPLPEQLAAYARLPLQLPLIWWAWRVRRRHSV
jgi:uncharacterized membrane protein